jgi:hypothetical protein
MSAVAHWHVRTEGLLRGTALRLEQIVVREVCSIIAETTVWGPRRSTSWGSLLRCKSRCVLLKQSQGLE